MYRSCGFGGRSAWHNISCCGEGRAVERHTGRPVGGHSMDRWSGWDDRSLKLDFGCCGSDSAVERHTHGRSRSDSELAGRGTAGCLEQPCALGGRSDGQDIGCCGPGSAVVGHTERPRGWLSELAGRRTAGYSDRWCGLDGPSVGLGFGCSGHDSTVEWHSAWPVEWHYAADQPLDLPGLRPESAPQRLFQERPEVVLEWSHMQSMPGASKQLGPVRLRVMRQGERPERVSQQECPHHVGPPHLQDMHALDG